jgi:sporulation protein YlmC with PRC-barrel domain
MSDESQEDRLSGPLDAVLHLLDRQVVAVDGRLVCKVDDLELTEFDDGVLAITALLSGAAARVPRYADRGAGQRLYWLWRRLAREQADREDPYRIDLELVRRLGSGVELAVGRDGLLVRQGGSGHRLNDLLQMSVQDLAGRRLGRVLDVRLDRDSGEPDERLRVTGLVVGQGRPGSYFGYDRRPDMGPWMVNRVVRWLHRHSAYVALDDLEDLDWVASIIRVDRAGLRSLEPAGRSGG